MMRPIALLLTALLVLSTACTVEDTDSSEGTPPPGEAFVEVLLSEFTIEMPDTTPAGTISFEISNTGEMEHGFAIEGAGVSQESDELAPTDTTTLTVELEPGTYTVWCPVGDHRSQGMEAQIEVTEPTASEGAPVEEGVDPGEQEDDDPDDGG